jgi:geranylgeranyl pyrophosphate synthase
MKNLLDHSPLLSQADFKQLFRKRMRAELVATKTICARQTAVISHAFDQAIERQAVEPYERPYYAYLGFKAHHGTETEELIKLCLALEFYNMALLLQDDVFDQDLVRNGQRNIYGLFIEETEKTGVPEKVAESSAILVGNLFFGLAFAKLDELTVSEAVKKNLRAVIFEANVLLSLGQLVDTRGTFDQLQALDISSIISGYRLKNQFNIEMPLHMGVILAEGIKSEWPTLFARPLGIAVQIVNDIDILFSSRFDEKTTSDLRNGKPTLITFLTWHSCDTAGKRFIESLMGNRNIGPRDIILLKEMMTTTQAVRVATDLCAQHCNQSAEALLSQSKLSPSALEAMLRLVDKTQQRAQ